MSAPKSVKTLVASFYLLLIYPVEVFHRFVDVFTDEFFHQLGIALFKGVDNLQMLGQGAFEPLRVGRGSKADHADVIHQVAGKFDQLSAVALLDDKLVETDIGPGILMPLIRQVRFLKRGENGSHIDDRKHFAEYVRQANQGKDVFDKQYLAKYVLEPKSHRDYLGLVGGKDHLASLGKWSQDIQAWCSLLQQSA